MNVIPATLRHFLLIASAAFLLAAPVRANTFMDSFAAGTSPAAPACTRDGAWCVSSNGTQMSVLARTGDGKLVERARLPLANDGNLGIASAPWKSVIRSRLNGRPEQVLVGIELKRSEAYSGGGGSLTELQLFSIVAGRHAPARPGLTVPLASSFMIRACFTPEDEKSRRGACHDEYHFAGELDLAKGSGTGEVSLLLKGRAETYPGRRTRLNDSGMEPPLRKSNLVWALNAECTFQRNIRWNPATGGLTLSRPLPSCEDFLQLQ